MKTLTGDSTRQITIAKPDEEVLVHDGSKITARSSKGTIGVGDPALTVIVGTKEEIDAEIYKLKLTEIKELPIEPKPK